LRDGERSGLVMMGRDYSYLAVVKTSHGLRVVRVKCLEANKGAAEKEIGGVEMKTGLVYLRVKVTDNAVCDFSYSTDGKRFESLGEKFVAQSGMWIGAKVGLFSLAPEDATVRGYADYDWLRIS
jgi:hypothetical protein